MFLLSVMSLSFEIDVWNYWAVRFLLSIAIGWPRVLTLGLPFETGYPFGLLIPVWRVACSVFHLSFIYRVSCLCLVRKRSLYTFNRLIHNRRPNPSQSHFQRGIRHLSLRTYEERLWEPHHLKPLYPHNEKPSFSKASLHRQLSRMPYIDK